MRRSIIIVFFLLMGLSNIVWGQDLYSKITDLDNRTDELLVKLSLHADEIYAAIATVCNKATIECAKIAKFNDQGDTTRIDRIPWLDPGVRSLDFRGDTLEISGHDFGIRSQFFLHRQSINGDSLATFDLVPPPDLYAMSIAGNITYGKHSIVFGNCRRTDTEEIPSLLFWVDQTGTVDSLMIIEDGAIGNQIYDIDIDPNGLLTVLLDFQEMTTGNYPYVIRRKKIVKYNQQMEEVWSWQTNDDYNFSTQNVSRLEILADGTMIIIAEDDNLFEEEIWGIVENGIKWKYSFPLGGSNRYKVKNLVEATNGDIIGCGQIRDGQVVDGDNGYLFRMSPVGEMIWEKIIVDNAHEIAGYEDSGQLRDIVELADGSILAGGYQTVWYENEQGQETTDRDLWLVRTDADGCILDDCDYVQDIPLSAAVPTIDNPSAISFFPNPATDVLYINWSTALTIQQIEIYNAMGQLVHIHSPTFSTAQCEVQDYPAGLYYVTLRDQEGKIYTEKVVIR